MNRRTFLKKSGFAFLALQSLPTTLMKSLIAEAVEVPKKKGKVFVYIFQRGGMDGLSLLAPYGDSNYYDLRKNIALAVTGPRPALKLDDHFALNAGMAGLKKYWDEGTLALITQAGSPDAGRSHFDSQDYIEWGTPGDRNTPDGFLNRTMSSLDPIKASPVRAIALQSNMPRVLTGNFPALSMNNLRDFGIQGSLAQPDELKGFESMYQSATDQIFRGPGKEVFEATELIKAAQSVPGDDRGYPKNGLGNHLRDIANLIKANIGLQVAVTEMGGWDTHVNQGDHDGQLTDRLTELSDALAAFAKDLGPLYGDVCVVTMTEFGRMVKENGNKGTDHGHGSVMMLLGGSVKGKKIYGQWKDLSKKNLFEERDVPVTTDFRAVLSEVLMDHLGVKNPLPIFPKFNYSPKNKLKLFG